MTSRGGAVRYDWNRIREQFVLGDDTTTLRGLAREHGCAEPTLLRRAARESWVEQRAQYREMLEARTRDMAATAVASVRARHVRLAQTMQEKALARLESLEPKELSPSELRQYLRDATDIERRAAGIPDPTERIDVRTLTDEELEAIVDGKRRW